MNFLGHFGVAKEWPGRADCSCVHRYVAQVSSYLNKSVFYRLPGHGSFIAKKASNCRDIP